MRANPKIKFPIEADLVKAGPEPDFKELLADLDSLRRGISLYAQSLGQSGHWDDQEHYASNVLGAFSTILVNLETLCDKALSVQLRYGVHKRDG